MHRLIAVYRDGKMYLVSRVELDKCGEGGKRATPVAKDPQHPGTETGKYFRPSERASERDSVEDMYSQQAVSHLKADNLGA